MKFKKKTSMSKKSVCLLELQFKSGPRLFTCRFSFTGRYPFGRSNLLGMIQRMSRNHRAVFDKTFLDQVEKVSRNHLLFSLDGSVPSVVREGLNPSFHCSGGIMQQIPNDRSIVLKDGDYVSLLNIGMYLKVSIKTKPSLKRTKVTENDTDSPCLKRAAY